MFFKPRLLTNPVLFILLIGTALILFPLFLSDSRAADSGPGASTSHSKRLPAVRSAPSTGDKSAAPATEAVPPNDGNSGSTSECTEVEIAVRIFSPEILNDIVA